MAKRRMFLAEIIGSDEFCCLSPKAQLLYFHLNMSADDDGMVGNANRILKSLSIPKKNLDDLEAAGFVIRFDKNVIAITHWLSHNRIKKDRYTPTRFTDEFNSLKIINGAIYIKESRAFYGDKTETFCPASAPQVSIGKDSIVKDSIGKGSIDEDSIVEESIDEISIDEDSFFINKNININKKTEPSEEGSDGDAEASDYLNIDKRTVTERFLSQVKLYILTAFNTIDDRGFIDYYSKRGWVDERFHPIASDYKRYVNEWMRKHLV